MKTIDAEQFRFKLLPKVTSKLQDFTEIAVDVLKAVEQCVHKGEINIAQGKHDNLNGDQLTIPITTYQPNVNVAIEALEVTFGKSGIAIAVVGEDHYYQKPEPHVAPLSSDAKAMKEIINSGEIGGFKPREIQKYQTIIDNRRSEKLSLAPKIQRWKLASLDSDRGDKLCELAAGQSAFPKPDAVVLERGLFYQAPLDTEVRETEYAGPSDLGWTIRQRSALAAAYVFMSAAGGDQSGNDRILAFFGEEHAVDILKFFEYFAVHSTQLQWVRKRKRNYAFLPSHVPRKKPLDTSF